MIKHMTAVEIEAEIKELHEKGLSANDIAAYRNSTVSTVRYYLGRLFPQCRHSLWPEWKINRLQELWGNPEHSASTIAEELNMSRNAIIGKAHRLGLAAPVKPSSAKAHRKPKEKQGFGGFNKAKTKWVDGSIIREVPVIAPTEAPAPTPHGIRLIDLESHHCRAVIGTGDDNLARFCGAEKALRPVWKHGQMQMERRSFCRAHCKLYYVGG